MFPGHYLGLSRAVTMVLTECDTVTRVTASSLPFLPLITPAQSTNHNGLKKLPFKVLFTVPERI